MKNKKEGFTLIELLAVIVILAIIALIATPIVLNLIEKTRKAAFMRSAEGILKSSKLTYSSNLLFNTNGEMDFYECSNNVCLSNRLDNNNKRIPLDIEGNVGDGSIKIHEDGDVEFNISDGRYCAIKHREEEKIIIEDGDCSLVDTRRNGEVLLSSYGGQYTYPTNGTFEIIKNLSGGVLTCASSDEEVATCAISGTIVTVIPGTKNGLSELTITSSGTAEYKEASAVYAVSTQNGLLTINASGYSGVYNGIEHGITVTCEGAIIKYGLSEGTYDLMTSPIYKDAGDYTVYYEVTKEGYNTVTGSKAIVIEKADSIIELSSTAGSYTYPTNGTFEITNKIGEGELICTSSDETIATCSILGTTVTIVPGAKGGTAYITVTSTETNNYNVGTIVHTATIKKGTLNVKASGYTGIYDGMSHGISVISEGATIKYGSSNGTYNLTSSPTYTAAGTYTVYYEVTKLGYTTVTDSKQVVINKANNTLKLSSSTGSYTYPTSGTFTVTSNPSGGKLSCTSSNTNVATCSISGTTVTVTPGTTSGSANITITSELTNNYNAGTIVHAVTTKLGTLSSITANGYNAEYDGKAHGISVSCAGATIKYGTANGTYNLTTSPMYTDVGTYTVYYQITKPGYATVTGSKQVIIKDTTLPTVSYNLASGTYNAKKTIRVTPSDANYSYMKVHVYKDGTMVNAKSTNNTTATYFDVALDSDGVWNVYAIVYDTSGNKQNQSPDNGGGWYYQIYTIDTTLPTVSYNLPTGTYTGAQTVRVTASDKNYSYMKVHLYKDGTIYSKNNSVTATYYDVALDSGGVWTIYTIAYDKAGNQQNQTPSNSSGWYYQQYTLDIIDCEEIKTFCQNSCSSAGQGYSSCMTSCTSGKSEGACTYDESGSSSGSSSGGSSCSGKNGCETTDYPCACNSSSMNSTHSVTICYSCGNFVSSTSGECKC